MPEIISKIKAKIKRFLRNKFIRPSKYVEWLANIVTVIKKNDTLKVYIEFRDLNVATPNDEYQIPVVEMLVDYAARFEYLSLLDGYSGYNQISTIEEDVAKTMFQCPGASGMYKGVMMPFGLKNVGATYLRVMNSMLHDFIKTFIHVYINDIVIKSSSKDGHLDHLQRPFKRMMKHGLKMKSLKCAFYFHACDFLGFVSIRRA